MSNRYSPPQFPEPGTGGNSGVVILAIGALSGAITTAALILGVSYLWGL